jgi:hypothetical protein
MFKKCLFFLPLIALIIFSCKKQATPDTKFIITAALKSGNSVSINWAAVKLAEFKNVTIYRSTSPIPDPTFETPIDGSLMIALLVDNTLTSFLDSNISIGSNGTVYYKAVVNLTNRFIVSELAQVNLNGFSLILPNNNNQFSSSYIVKQFSPINALYILNQNQGSLSMVDYSQKKLTVSVNYSSNGTTILYPVINNNKPEVFLYINNGTIICYDGTNLQQKYSLNLSNGYVSDFKVKNGFLYALNGTSMYIYDLSNQSFVTMTTIGTGFNGNLYNVDIFTGSQSNLLFAKYYTQNDVYQSSTGNYVDSYKNTVMAYNLINGIPTNGTVLNIAALNGDTTNSINISNNSYIQVSPDGNYVTCNQNGDIYSIVNNTSHNIRSANNFNPTPYYSYDGKYVLGKTIFNSNGINSNTMDAYALPGFNLATSFRTQNSGSPIFADDFMDNDTLVSYNIAQTLVNNQSSNTLTVLFKKID